MERKNIELLAPAGDMERLHMAVAYGADAVYLAGNAFGMRSFAGNFTPEELKAAAPVRPVILLTANDTDMDIVVGLEQGADDYITKPFSLSVLRARVNTQLRKNAVSVPAKTFQIDRFVFDFDQMQFSADGANVELSKTEQKLLRLLVENQGNAMSRGDLIDRIWTDGAEYVDENALSVTVKRLRDKLGAQNYIQTVYGIGYMWGKKHG